MKLISEIKNPTYFCFREGLEGRSIYYAGENPFYVKKDKKYDYESNKMVPCDIDMIKLLRVGKTTHYGIILLDNPIETSYPYIPESTSYTEIDITPKIHSAISCQENYTKQCKNYRDFRESFEMFLKNSEAFLQENYKTPFADTFPSF